MKLKRAPVVGDFIYNDKGLMIAVIGKVEESEDKYKILYLTTHTQKEKEWCIWELDKDELMVELL